MTMDFDSVFRSLDTKWATEIVVMSMLFNGGGSDLSCAVTVRRKMFTARVQNRCFGGQMATLPHEKLKASK